MNPPPEPQPWPRYRWLVAILFVLALQAGTVLWLVDRPPVAPPSPPPALQVFFPPAAAVDWQYADDPTLFILPNRHSFSGPAWMNTPTFADLYQPEEPSSPPRPLPLPVAQLAAGVGDYVQTNLPRPFALAARPESSFDDWNLFPDVNHLATQSSVRLDGDLVRRPLLSAFQTNAWTNSTILSNSLVGLTVDGDGHVFTATLLGKSGSPEADASALAQARTARFQPAPPETSAAAPPGLTWGTVIFRWQTVPPPATNAVPPPPGGS